MKSPLCSSVGKAALFIVLLALCFGGSTVAQAAGNDILSLVPEGSLKVYSATDEFHDGDAWYFPHSSYTIYTIDGKLVKKIKNQRFPDDEIPEIVPLPVGAYTVLARSERQGYTRTRVVIIEAQQTVLDLNLWKKPMSGRLPHN